MNQLDTLYRALTDYKKQTGENRECGIERKSVASANKEDSAIEVVKTLCTVEEDWLVAVEEGLIHIQKAINEARQFIRTRGEVVPIEKVKRVSKDSVEHLARHSDLITKEQEDEDIIPDRLYMVERLNDFAVYENRFLYMLLSYLKNFIGHRYDKIIELTSAYYGSVVMNKTVAMSKRKTVIELKLIDERQDDEYLKENNPLKSVIDRIDAALKTVMFFLSTPLMQEVSKVPMLKPPITKTNVLRMNKNFKGAVTLYDFVRAYDKPGYSVEKYTERMNPLSDDAANEFSEGLMMAAFLTYKYGLNLEKLLKKSYEDEEVRRKIAEDERLKEQLKQLKKRVAESGCDPTEYILLLEKRIKLLEQDSAQLVLARQEIGKLNTDVADLKQNITELRGEIVSLKHKHTDEIASLISGHEKEIAGQAARFKAEFDEVKQRHFKEVETLNSVHESEISALNELHQKETEERDGKITDLETVLTDQRTRFSVQIQNLESTLDQKNLEFNQMSDAKSLFEARLNALRKEHNLIAPDEDFTSQAAFDELEKQYKIFKAFIKEEWQKTKKKIKKEVRGEG